MSALPAPIALGHAAVALRPFREGTRLFLTVVVKATLRLAHKRAMTPLSPSPVLGEEVYRAWAPPAAGIDIAPPVAASVAAAAENAPYLQRADVIVTGHAHAPGGRPVPSMAVSLRVGEGSTTRIDKTLHVIGDRTGGGGPLPFTAMPLVYELAPGGPHDPDNPVGADPRAGRIPNIVDPRRPGRAAGFGPIAAHWPVRQRRLGGADPRALAEACAVLPARFDWAYFQAAPADQQTAHLHGREWIVLEGMHPELPRIEAWLPGAAAKARIHFAGSPPAPLQLAADMLVIDADRWVCSLLWRAAVAVPSAAALASATVAARVALPGENDAWEGVPPAAPPAPVSEAPPPSRRRVRGLVVQATGAAPGSSRGRPAQPSPVQASPAQAAPRAVRSATAVMNAIPGDQPALPFRGAAAKPRHPSGAVPSGLPFVPSSRPPTLPPSVPAWAPPSVPPWAGAAPPAPEAVSPWAAGLPFAPPRPSIPAPFVAPPPSAALPSADAAAHGVAPSAPPPPRRARKPGLRAPSSAPLVPPRKRRPAKVAEGGVGAQFLRSASATRSGAGAPALPAETSQGRRPEGA